MNRSAVGLAYLLVGLALVVSTGAIPADTDELRPDVHLYPSPDDPAGHTTLTADGQLAISRDTPGVNPDARYRVDSAFVIAYTGDGRATVRIVDDAPAVHFFTGSHPATTSVESPVELASGESIEVGVVVDTSDAGAGARVLDEVSFDVAVEEPSDATVSADVGRSPTPAADPDPATVTPAAFRIADVRIDRGSATVGEPVVFAVTVENVGGRAGEHAVRVAAGGERIAGGPVEVRPGERATRTFTHAFAEAGTYPIAVDGQPFGTVVVTRETAVPGSAGSALIDPGAPPEPDAPTRSPAVVDPLLILVAIALLVVSTVLVRRLAGGPA